MSPPIPFVEILLWVLLVLAGLACIRLRPDPNTVGGNPALRERLEILERKVGISPSLAIFVISMSMIAVTTVNSHTVVWSRDEIAEYTQSPSPNEIAEPKPADGMTPSRTLADLLAEYTIKEDHACTEDMNLAAIRAFIATIPPDIKKDIHRIHIDAVRIMKYEAGEMDVSDSEIEHIASVYERCLAVSTEAVEHDKIPTISGCIAELIAAAGELKLDADMAVPVEEITAIVERYARCIVECDAHLDSHIHQTRMPISETLPPRSGYDLTIAWIISIGQLPKSIVCRVFGETHVLCWAIDTLFGLAPPSIHNKY